MQALRETSLQAYAQLVRDGRISKAQLLAWSVLQQHGALTGRELDALAETAGLWKRLSELKRLGLIIEAGIRECRSSGRQALTWRIVTSEDFIQGLGRLQRKTRARRRWWLALTPEGTVRAAGSRALCAAHDDCEIVEVREVIRAAVAAKEA
jgi:hypothetical protein